VEGKKESPWLKNLKSAGERRKDHAETLGRMDLFINTQQKFLPGCKKKSGPHDFSKETRRGKGREGHSRPQAEGRHPPIAASARGKKGNNCGVTIKEEYTRARGREKKQSLVDAAKKRGAVCPEKEQKAL